MSRDMYDIIVIGGGPAGSSAALRAARRGARVLLLEKQPMPRPKLCGGWVSERAIGLLDVDLPASLTARPFLRASLEFRDVSQVYRPDEQLGIFVDRAQFDHHLFDQARDAGVDWSFESVRGITLDSSRYVVTSEQTTYRSQAVVLCVGSNSPLITQLRPVDAPDQSAIAIEQRIPAEYADRWELVPGDAWLSFGVVDYGYGWALHHGDYLLVGVGAMRSRVENIRSLLAELWHQWQLPLELFAPEGHLIPLGGHKRLLGRGRMLSAGDAAGMVDPFNGEGIAGAIRSGQLAADALVEHAGDDAARVYVNACTKELLNELRTARRVADLFHGLPERLVRGFCSDPRLAAEYHDVLRQRLTYAAFMRRLVTRRLFGTAAPDRQSTVAESNS